MGFNISPVYNHLLYLQVCSIIEEATKAALRNDKFTLYEQ